MLALILALAGGATGGVGTGSPTGAPELLSAEVGSLSPGEKGVSDAQVRVSWDVLAPDPSNYETRVFQDGVLAATVENNVESYDITVRGYYEGGHTLKQTITWRFRVDIVRKSDGVAVSSRATNELTITYGTNTQGL